MNDELIVYDYDSSPCVRRVKMTLIEKGKSYQRQIVDLTKMEQKSPEYLAINPNGLVPTLAHNGRIIFESGVIVDYLNDIFPQNSLYPKSLTGRLQVKNWQKFELALAKEHRPLMYARALGPLSHIAYSYNHFMDKASLATDNSAYLEWESKVWHLKVLDLDQQTEQENKLSKFLRHLDNHLKEQHSKGKHYLVEDQFTFADLSVYPRIKMLPTGNVPFSARTYPNISRWFKRVEKRAAIQSTVSKQERSLHLLTHSGVLPFINRTLYKNESQKSFIEKALLKSLGKVIRKNMDKGSSGKQANDKLIAPRAVNSTQKDLNENRPKGALFEIEDAALLNEGSLTLFGDRDTPETTRTQKILAASNIPYQFVSVDSTCALNDDLLHLNPCGELPFLVHQLGNEQRVLADALSIAEYINPAVIDLKLFSSDAYRLAEIRMWNAFDAGMHKEYGMLYRAYASSKTATPISLSAQQRKDAIAIFSEKIQLMETPLSQHAFLAGENMTYADLCLWSRLLSFNRLGLDGCFKNAPNVKRWLIRTSERFELMQPATVVN